MPSISSPDNARPQDFTRLLDQMAARPTPAVVFYGHDGGRVELSGRVLENWVAKTANLLVDDLGLMPGDHVLVDASLHWRTAVVIAAAWRLGAVVVLSGAADAPSGAENGAAASPRTSHPVELAVIQDPGEAAATSSAAEKAGTLPGVQSAAEVMALAYPGLAMSLEPERLPAGAIDYCAEIRVHGDQWSGASRPGPEDVCLLTPAERLTHARFFSAAAALGDQLQAEAIGAVHLDADSWSAVSLERLVATWLAGSTAVLTDLSAERPHGGSHEGAEGIGAILAAERVGLSWS